MVHLMRKYKKYIWWGIIIICVPTFVYWGTGGARARRARATKGGGNPGEQAVATVGKIPILAAQFMQELGAEEQRYSEATGKRPTRQELVKNGTADAVLERLINTALLNTEVQRMKFDADRAFLTEQLKKDRGFEDDKGNFDPNLWNEWLESDPKRNWNTTYDSVRDQVGRKMILERVQASARVTDAELKKQFEADYTKLQVKFVTIDPPIDAAPEQIQATYEKDPTRYEIPEKRAVEFVAIDMQPPRPALLDELVTRARNGEDFAALAKEHSKSRTAESGGSLGWVEDKETNPDYLKELMKIPVGKVGDPVEYFGSYYVYQVEEEKTDPVTNVRSVNAREIMIRPALDEADRTAREAKADQIASKAAEAGDLNAAAQEAGLSVQTAADIAKDSLTVANVPKVDSYRFRTGVIELGKGELSNVIKGSQNFYVARVTEVTPPVPQALEAVHDKVLDDTEKAMRRSQERATQVMKLADEMYKNVTSLEQIVEKYPDQKPVIKMTDEFTRKDFLIKEQGAGDSPEAERLYVRGSDVYTSVGEKEPGGFGPPVLGINGQAYFVELAQKTPPTEENWKKDWPEEEKKLRKNALTMARNRRLNDYTADLRDRLGKEVVIQKHPEVINELLGVGRDKDGETPEAPKPGETASSTATPATPATPAAAAPAAPAPAAPVAPANPEAPASQ